MKKLILSLCLFSLVIFTRAGITVTSPNGGEVWAGCTSHNITWTSSGVSNYFNIDYSTDNGATWVSVASSYYVTTGTYPWTVPNINSTACLLRIVDANTPSISDISNSTFSITAPLIITSANGGESWEGGTIRTITWVASGTTNYYDLYYSTNAGSTWNTITTNYYSTTGQYSWSVPNTPSTTCLIKVCDHTNTTCMSDVSNNLFTITPATPVLTVTNPNTTQTRYIGNSSTISWTSSYVTSNALKIDYSIDNGSNWIPITTNTTNTGSYTWIVPNTPSTQCLVKITDLGNPATFDVSNTTFTIAPPFITVTYPNGGESFVGCSSKTILWSYAGTGSNFKIEYSINNGAVWNVLTTTATSGSYTWSPVPSVDATGCLVRVSDAAALSTKDSNNAGFNIVRNTDIIVTSPNGGESWEAGVTKPITWVSAATSTYFNVYYSTNNGTSWTTLATNTSAHSYNWSVPNLPSTTCLIKVEDYYNTCITDNSNAVFTIAPPTPIITVIAPNTASTLYVGSSSNITWSSQYITSAYVRIQYTINNGTSWTEIAAITENDGTYAWVIPGTPSNQCRVRISEYNNAPVYDESNVNFTIANPFITITSPNGGESWIGCSSQTVSWTSGGVTGSYYMYYSTNNGALWNLITTTTSTSYTWTPIPSLSSIQCLFKVTNSGATVTDSSNASFTINPNTDIVVTSPNGGESWEAGMVKTINWVSAATSTYFNVYYSTNNGSTWTTLLTNSSAHTYNWTVPNIPSTSCLVKVEDYYNNCINDNSNAVFTIAPPTPVITVTNPNTAVTLYSTRTATISWTTQYVTSSYVHIDYTINNGASWIDIAAITENDGSYIWTIPATYSNQCRLRITDNSNALLFDESNVNFTIAPPLITVTYPNGGELIEGCSSQTITWNALGTSNSYKLYYSINNSTDWTFLGTTTSTSYLWNPILSVNATQCYFKVEDASYPLVKDSNNTTFSIYKNIDIVVTAPNGGESWEVGTIKTINWVSETTSTRFNLYYSTNNGSTWNTLLTNTSVKTYNWTIPNSPSTQCQIKVEDYYNTCIYDINDANFTISPPTPVITVTAPNTATTYYVGKTNNITWTSSYLTSSFVAIDYTINNGATWNSIISITENDGTYAWTVPNTVSNQCRVRINEYNNLPVNDESNVNFIIAQPYITVTYPNGGELLEGCTSQSVTWTAGGTSNSYKLSYSTDNGSTWNTIVNGIGATSYAWNPVVSLTSSQCLVKVEDYTNAAVKDSSNSTFGIYKNIDIVVTTPNGGESWEVGTVKTINWVSETSSSYFNLYYSTNNGSTWTTIATNTSAHTYNWTVPNVPSTQCQIKIEDYYNNCIFDINNANFTISPPTPVITVTAPNTATTYYVGKSYNITWTSAYLTSSFVSIDYTSNNGITWNSIMGITENDGTYAWTVPNSISNQCRIRVNEYNNLPVYDESNVNFTIAAPFISVTYPNGGEVWEKCTSPNLTWTAGGTSGTYRISYSTNNGSAWTLLTSTSSTSYTWSPVNITPSTSCLIKIDDNGSTTIKDSSNAVFTVTPNDDIIITSANGGEQWQAGSTQTISWVSAATSSYFNVYYSIDNGVNWNTIITNTSAHSYNWTVPNSPSSICLIRVIDYYNSCIDDQSNSTFSITPGTPRLLTPNGNLTMYYAQNYNITWTNQYFNGTYVSLNYSIDSGATWQPIASVTNNTGSYSWSVPNVASSRCLVKVNEYNNAAVYDVSDAVFAIAPALVINTPNGDNGVEEWRVCTQTTIHWTSGGCSGTWKLEYSINNGTSWNSITNSYVSSGSNNSYDWIIPNTPSTQCLIRVTDVSNSAKTDVSDAVFSIKPSITILTPNGGQSLTIGSIYNITWIAPGASNYYNFDYSINGGSTWTSIAYNQNITTGTYAWTVPSASSASCFIRITDNVNTCKTDISDVAFSIGMPVPVITVTSPNGGEILSGCNNKIITWTATNTSSNYTLEYSTNSGTTWSTIISNYNTLGGSYTWVVPNISSTTCLVRVRDFSNPTIMDVSNAPFTINQSVTATISAGGPTSFCTGGTVVLTSSSATGNVWYPSGQTSQSITVGSSGPNYVVVTNTGCSATSNTITVGVTTAPSAPVASSNSPVPLNGTIILNAGTIAGASYSWTGPISYTSAAQNPTIANATIARNGVYSVIATVNGCSSPAGSTTVSVTATPATVTVIGNILTESGNFVNTTKVKVTGTTTDSLLTSSNGQYQFMLTQGGNYTITPSKNNDITVCNGISTLDLVLIQRHILNTQLLSSPYKIIAADVNNSGTVTNLDIVLIRSLILQNSTTYPSGKQWAFVNSSYVFPNAQNPFPYESTRTYSNIAAAVDQNFIGVRYGDVNNSYDPNVSKNVSSTVVGFSMDSKTASFGDIITVPVHVNRFTNISGFQYTLSWNPAVIEYVSANNGSLAMNFGTSKIANGNLTALWSTENLNGYTLTDGSVIFELKFRVIGSCGSTSPIAITSAMTSAEAYNNNTEQLSLEVNSGTVSVQSALSVINAENLGYALFQNAPNPFSNTTEITFTMPSNDQISISIFDMLGNIVALYEGHYSIGKHSIVWDGSNNNGLKLADGTYFCKMQSGKFTKTIKMALMR
ncbi:MAG: FlgD immunoglobulin-like domain containing protein [Bacteroidota bacterium]